MIFIIISQKQRKVRLTEIVMISICKLNRSIEARNSCSLMLLVIVAKWSRVRCHSRPTMCQLVLPMRFIAV